MEHLDLNVHERTKGYETSEDGTTRIFKLYMPNNEELQAFQNQIKSDFDIALEDANLDFDNLESL